MSDVCLETAASLAARIRRHEVSSLELVEAFAERHARLNTQLNAIVVPNFDAARAQAREADAQAERGEFRGALHGVPITVKEAFDVSGLPTCVGEPSLQDNRPEHNALAVQRLLDAGAVLLGKTNLSHFMMDLQSFNDVYGVSNNPWDASRSPGGSSGGSAAAIAAGLSALELGSDLAGSIRGPAHFCGVYGHKSTYGLVPTRGHFGPPGRQSELDLTVCGPLARSAEDLELALQVLANPQGPGDVVWDVQLPPARHEALENFRVGVWLEDPGGAVDEAVFQLLRSAMNKLKETGCRISEGPPDDLKIDDFYADYFALSAGTVAGLAEEKIFRLARFWGRVGALFGRRETNSLFGYCQRMNWSHRQWSLAVERKSVLKRRLARYFETVDVLLMPVVTTAALSHHPANPRFYSRKIPCNGREIPYAEQMKWPALASYAGLPATVAPIGLTDSGLPVGLQIVGGELDDLTTIAFARLMAQVTGAFRAPNLD